MENITVDYDSLREETLTVTRCALVVKGGRRFSFSAWVAVGNENGVVGIGHGKAGEVSSAISKAAKEARKKLVFIERSGTSIPHSFKSRYCSSQIIIIPARPGTGVIACTPVRALMSLAGVHDVLTKSFGSNNPVNLVKATLDALVSMRSKETFETLRGVKIS